MFTSRRQPALVFEGAARAPHFLPEPLFVSQHRMGATDSRASSGACVPPKGIKAESTDVKIGTKTLLSRPAANIASHPTTAVFVGGKSGASSEELFAVYQNCW